MIVCLLVDPAQVLVSHSRIGIVGGFFIASVAQLAINGADTVQCVTGLGYID